MWREGGICMMLLLYFSGVAYSYVDNDLELHCKEGWTLAADYCFKFGQTPVAGTYAEKMCRANSANFLHMNDFWVPHFDELTNGSSLWISLPQFHGDINLQDYQNLVSENVCVVAEKEESTGIYKNRETECLYEVHPALCVTHSCPKDTFACPDHQCVSNAVVCDGEFDCIDFSDEQNCPERCSYTLRMEEGEIIFPSNATNYTNIWECNWYIETPLSTYIEFTVEQVDLEKEVHSLNIFARKPNFGHFYGALDGDDTINKTVYTHYNFATIELASTKPLTQRDSSFRIKFRAHKEDQFKTVIATDDIQTIRYKGNPYSPSIYRITAEDGVSPFTVKTTSQGLVDIFDRGNRRNHVPYISSFGKMTYCFDGEPEPFTVQQGCSYILNRTNQVVKSPGLEDYPNNVECNITVDSGDQAVGVLIEEKYIHDSDSLKIYSGNKLVPVPDDYTVIKNGKFIVQFKSDSIFIDQGFELEYSTGCPSLNFNMDETTIEKVFSDAGMFEGFQTLSVQCKKNAYFINQLLLDLSTKLEIVCLNGKWFSSGELLTIVPLCEGYYCPLAPAVQNGYVTLSEGNMQFGGNLTYECQPGYEIQGSSLVNCERGWSDLPSCQASTCGTAPKVKFAQMNVTNGVEGEFGSIVEYICEEGYEIIGHKWLHCKGNAWPTDAPVCKEKTCFFEGVAYSENIQPLSIPVHGSIWIACNDGYYRDPDVKEMNCMPNGQFDVIFTCKNVDECQGRDKCEQNCHDTDGSYVCSCRDGYVLKGDYACEEINLCESNPCDGECVPKLASYECKCGGGLTLFTANGTEGFTIPDGETGLEPWSVYRINHTCVLKQCSTPVLQTNAHITQVEIQKQYHFGDDIKFVCDVGYEINGKTFVTVQCTSQGTWSQPSPSCQRATCDVPKIAPGTYPNQAVQEYPELSVSQIAFGEEVKLNCTRPGFINPSFSRFLKCTIKDEQYVLDGSVDYYDCGFVDCGTPTKVPGSTYRDLDQTTYGNTFTFGCANGLEVRGGSLSTNDNKVACLSTGQWDFGSLACPVVQCKDPGRPARGKQLVSDYRLNQKTTFSCNKNLTLDSDSDGITCTGSGTPTFDKAVPECKDKTPPTITCGSGEIFVPKYTDIADYVPEIDYNDNIAVSYIEVSPAYPSGILTSPTSEFTFNVFDWENNSASCKVVFKLIDNTVPKFLCPVDKKATWIKNNYGVCVEPPKLLNVGGNAEVKHFTTKINGGYFEDLITTVYPPILSDIIRVQVTSDSNRRTCLYHCEITPPACDIAQLLAPPNSVLEQTDATAFSLSCKPGYAFYAESNGPKEKTYTCPLNDDVKSEVKNSKCTKIDGSVKAAERLKLKVTYQTGTAFQAKDCDYGSSFVTKASEKDYVVKACEELQFNISHEDTSIQYTDFFVKVIITASLNFGKNVPADYERCRAIIASSIRSSFEIFDFKTIDSKNCPEMKANSTQILDDERFYCEHDSEFLQYEGNTGYCAPCPEGSYVTENSCLPCPVGQYNDLVGQTSCKMCDAGKSTKGNHTIYAKECLGFCEPGLYSEDGLPPCKSCAMDSYWVNSTYCQPCGENEITRQAMSTTSGECVAPCPPGYYSEDGYGVPGVDCKLCPMNFYNELSGQDQCIECQANETTLNTGSKSKNDCLLVKDHSTCEDCRGTCKQILPHILSCVCDEGYFGPDCKTRVYDSVCDSMPCLNGGTCIPTDDGFRCECPVATSDRVCGIILKTCSDDSCDNFGMCENTPQGPKCHCLNGFSGYSCEIKQDLCDAQPCKNGGTCQSFGTTRFVCRCDSGYGGATCEESIDDCYTKPCRNFGSCVDQHENYTCDCSDDKSYTGRHCETMINPCDGKCGDDECIPDYVLGTFYCLCGVDAYQNSGGMCQAVDPCSPNPCKNGMNCSNGECICSSGFLGSLCQYEDHCADVTCQNGGTCAVEKDSHKCHCLEGFEGDLCESKINNCKGECTEANTNNCTTRGETYYCSCKEGYTGVNCEVDIDDCASNPCMHDGACSDRVNGYSCRCDEGWTGKQCEETMKYCSTSTCKNGGKCFDLSTSFYCECEPNFFGTNCEQKVDICEITKPCVHGTCEPDGSGGVRCVCDFGYYGDRCEYKKDLCRIENLCGPNGECHEYLGNYTCKCDEGFTGRNCETKIDHCSSLVCPPTATCLNQATRAFCRCPVNASGPHCNKSRDLNFDLEIFQPPVRSPYYIQLESAKFSIALWVQVKNSVTLLELYEKIARKDHLFASLSSVDFRINIENQVYIINHQRAYNDGQWHYVVIQVDGEKGEMTMVVDTVQSDPVTIPTRTIFDLKFVVNFGKKSTDMRGTKFSNVVIYERNLSFKDITLVGNEVVDTVFPGAIFLLDELETSDRYLLHWPSQAGRSCYLGYTNFPDCDQMKPGKRRMDPVIISPFVYVTNGKRLTQVDLSLPTDTGGVTVIPKYDSGHTFTWGRYLNVIATRKGDGVVQMSYQNIYLTDELCPDPFIRSLNRDLDVKRSFNTATMYTFNTLLNRCKNGYDYSIPSPRRYYCSTKWDIYEPYLPFRSSPCGAITEPLFNVELSINYTIDSTECKAVTDSLVNSMRNSVMQLNGKFNICTDANCPEAKVNMDCSNFDNKKSHLSGTINLPKIKNKLKIEGNKNDVSTEELFASPETLNVDTLFDYSKKVYGAVPQDFNAKVMKECIPPTALQNGECVVCEQGTYYDNSTRMCKWCPIGQFNSKANQYSCERCNDIGPDLTTEQVGAVQASECKDKCSPGQYHRGRNCAPCPIGFYQHEEGRFFCYPCPADTTTLETGTLNRSQCANLCPPGQQVRANNQSKCEPCPIGFFRTDQTSCIKCPEQYVTNTTGSKLLADCTVVNNPAGTKRTGNGDASEPCPVGTYQPKKHQWSCIKCEGSLTTANTQSDSKEDCIFVCPPGSEKISGKDECQMCPIGFYRDGVVAQAQCAQCPGNFVTTFTGAKSAESCTRYKCFAGSKANVDNDACVPCDLGEFQDLNFQNVCKICPMGTYTLDTGSKKESDCQAYCKPGNYKNESGDCTPCKRGYYRNNDDNDFFGPCKICPKKYTTAAGGGAESIKECSVLACAKGAYGDYEAMQCMPCRKGTYQDKIFQDECLACPESFTTVATGSVSPTDCKLTCSPGSENIQGTETCTPCKVGYYKANTAPDLCSACHADMNANNILITSTEGANSAALCNQLVCIPGYTPGASECEPCDYGTYQPEKWKQTCIGCDKGKTTYAKGAISSSSCLLDCPKGQKFVESENKCEACPIGSYRDKTDPEDYNCITCPNGKLTASEGAVSEADCTIVNCQTLGTYRSQDANKCMNCPVGTYQNVIQQTECKNCPSGYTTKEEKSDEDTDCKLDCDAGTYLDEGKAPASCMPCAVGFYRTKATWECEQCPQDLTTKGVGSKSSADCSLATCQAGSTYLKTDGKCVNCPLHHYQDMANQMGPCKPCKENTYTDGLGKKSPEDCKTQCNLNHDCDAGVEDCVNDPADSRRFRCDCKKHYERNNQQKCIHKCDTNYCGDKGTCQREDATCVCHKNYYGERCERRYASESISSQRNRDMIIGGVSGLGFLLILAAVIVACCVFRKRKNTQQKANRSFDRQSLATNSDMPNFGGMKPVNSMFNPKNSFSDTNSYKPYGGPRDNSVYFA